MDTASWVTILAQKENANDKDSMMSGTESKEVQPQGTSISKQQLEFTILFEFTEDEKLIEDYACAYQKDKTFAHGRIYFSEHYVSFFSSLFAAVKLKIPVSTIIDIQKKNTAILFPNAIEITVKDQQKLFFSSFLYRDKAFQTLSNLIGNRGKVESGNNGEEQESTFIADVSKNQTFSKAKTSALTVSNSSSTVIYSSSPAVSINDSTKKFSHKSFDESVLKKESTSPPPSSSSSSSIQTGKERSNSSGRTIAVDEISSDIESESSRKRRSLSFTLQQLQSSASIELQDRSILNRANTISSFPPHSISSPPPNNNNTSLDSITITSDTDSKHVSPNSSFNIPENIPCSHFTEFKEEFYINEQIPEISVERFYSLFLADTSDFWMEVNKEFSYADTTITPWSSESNGKCCIYRNLSFVAPVNQRFGPKSTKVMQTHRVRVNSSKQFILETFSTSKDVPYGDAFNVVNRFVISNLPDNKSKGILFQAATFIKFSRSVWGIQSMIEKSASASGREFSQKFISLAKLKLSKLPPPLIENPTSGVSAILQLPSMEIQAPSEASSSLAVSPSVSSVTSFVSPPIQNTNGFTKARFIQELGESSSFMKLTALISVSTLLLLLVIFIPFTFHLYSHVNKLELQHDNMHRSAEKMESKIEFMTAIIEALAQDNSQLVNEDLMKYFGKDKAGMTLGELWRSWKMNGEIVGKYEYWKKQLFDLQEEIILAKNFLDGSSSFIEPVSNQPIATISVWGIIMYILELIVLLLLLTTAIVVLYLQFYQKKFKQD